MTAGWTGYARRATARRAGAPRCKPCKSPLARAVHRRTYSRHGRSASAPHHTVTVVSSRAFRVLFLAEFSNKTSRALPGIANNAVVRIAGLAERRTTCARCRPSDFISECASFFFFLKRIPCGFLFMYRSLFLPTFPLLLFSYPLVRRTYPRKAEKCRRARYSP